MIFYNRGEIMNKQELFYKFLKSINKNNKLTLLFKTIFNYHVLNDYNYISRFFSEHDNIIIDIYDNILDNRFNRYIFNFRNVEEGTIIKFDEYVMVTTINVNSDYSINNNLMRLCYLFSDKCSNMKDYAISFMPKDIVIILENIIKK